MPVIYQRWIRRSDLFKHRDWLFLFGDNEEKKGLGGLAKQCRGEPNACGIPTKRRPSMNKEDFWYDEDYSRVTPLIDAALKEPVRHLQRGGYVVLPEAGIGTGLAKLCQTAPSVFQYLQKSLSLLPGITTADGPAQRKGDVYNG